MSAFHFTRRTSGYIAIVLGLIFCICGLNAPSTLAAEAEGEPSFVDIEGHWAKPVIEWGWRQGIANGSCSGDDLQFENGQATCKRLSFLPDDYVTEPEFLAMYFRSMGAVTQNGPGYNWDQPYYEYAKVNHYPVTTYSPNGENGFQPNGGILVHFPISREYVAGLIVASMGKNFSFEPSPYRFKDYAYLMDNGYAKGKVESSDLEIAFAPYDNLTRAEALQFIYNIKQKGDFSLKPRPIDGFDIQDPQPSKAIVESTTGTFTIELFSKYAPKSVEQFTTLAKSKFYDGMQWENPISLSTAVLAPDMSPTSTIIDGIENISHKDSGLMKKAAKDNPYYAPIGEDLGRKRGYERGMVEMDPNGKIYIYLSETQPSTWSDQHTIIGKISSGLDTATAISEAKRSISIRAITVTL